VAFSRAIPALRFSRASASGDPPSCHANMTEMFHRVPEHLLCPMKSAALPPIRLHGFELPVLRRKRQSDRTLEWPCHTLPPLPALRMNSSSLSVRCGHTATAGRVQAARNKSPQRLRRTKPNELRREQSCGLFYVGANKAPENVDVHARYIDNPGEHWASRGRLPRSSARCHPPYHSDKLTATVVSSSQIISLEAP